MRTPKSFGPSQIFNPALTSCTSVLACPLHLAGCHPSLLHPVKDFEAPLLVRQLPERPPARLQPRQQPAAVLRAQPGL
jgi:hypothetical protein